MKSKLIYTFPRSGHHWLMSLIQDACKLPVGWHTDEHLAKVSPGTIVIKSHAFDFNKSERSPVIIQWRQDWLAAMYSWYDLWVSDFGGNDGPEHCKKFISSQFTYAVWFYRVFVASMDYDVVYYEDIVDDPCGVTLEIASRLGLHQVCNPYLTKKEPRKIQDHRYYDQDFCKKLYSQFNKEVRR